MEPKNKKAYAVPPLKKTISQGFALISFLVLFGLLLVITFGGLLVLATIQKSSVQQDVCRSSVIEIENRLLAGLNRLLALNPQAAGLRLHLKEVNAALVAAKAAGQVEVAAGLELIKQRIIFSQKTLQKQQKLIISRTEVAANQNAAHLQREKGFQVPEIPIKVHVKAEPPDSLTPDYLPSEPFSVKQRVSAYWQSPVAEYFPIKNLPKNLVPTLMRNRPLQGACSASLFKKGSNQWQVELARASR